MSPACKDQPATAAPPPPTGGEGAAAFLARCFICPATGQPLRATGDGWLVASGEIPLAYPVENGLAWLAPEAPHGPRAGSPEAQAEGCDLAVAAWISGALGFGGEEWGGAHALEFVPGMFRLDRALSDVGAEAAGVVRPKDLREPVGMPAAVVQTFKRLPVREGAFDHVFLLDPRLWKVELALLLDGASCALRQGGTVWLMLPLEGSSLLRWVGQLRGGRFSRFRAFRRMRRVLAKIFAQGVAAAVERLGCALREARGGAGGMDPKTVRGAARASGLKWAGMPVPDLGLVCLKKGPQEKAVSGESRPQVVAEALPEGVSEAVSEAAWRLPVNYRAPDCSEAAIGRDSAYALRIFEEYCAALPGGASGLAGKRVLELGPGNNLATSLCLAASGAKVCVADKYPVRWLDSYHAPLYRAVRDLLLRKFPGADPAPIDLCLEFGGHAPAAASQLPCPAENLSPLEDGSVDITFSCAVLEHVCDPASAARELARVTRAGGHAIHQVDFRDHRDFSRPLEYLLPGLEEFRAMFDACHGECGNRIRPEELLAHMGAAGFEAISAASNIDADPVYLAEFLPRLRAAAVSPYRDWPGEKLREVSALVVARRRQAAESLPGSDRSLPVLEWGRELSSRFWQRISGSDYLVSKAFSRIAGDLLLDLLRGVLKEDWKCVDFGSGANGFVVEKMLGRGMRCASYEPSRGNDAPAYPFAGHPLYLGEAARARDGEFDCLLATEVIEHVHDQDFPAFMRRARALLKPGGLAVFTTPNREDLLGQSVFCPIAEVLFHPWQHLRSWRPESLEIFLEGYGFRTLAVHQVDFGPFYPLETKLRRLREAVAWLAKRHGSLSDRNAAMVLQRMLGPADDRSDPAVPALPLRGREVHGAGTHLLYIGQSGGRGGL